MTDVNKNKFFLLLGMVGAVIVIFGLTQPNAQLYYIFGAFLLLITAVYYKFLYFMALELVLISGHTASLLGISRILQMVLPIILCLQLLFFYAMTGHLNNIFVLIGILGVGLISIGFGFAYTWVFFIGSMSVAIYAFYLSYRKKKFALLWGSLNAIFAAVALMELWDGRVW